jgi:hypothetical protein
LDVRAEVEGSELYDLDEFYLPLSPELEEFPNSASDTMEPAMVLN